MTAWPAILVKLAEHSELRVAAAALCTLGVKLLEPVPQVCECVSTSVDMQRLCTMANDRMKSPTSIRSGVHIDAPF
jgi:hypothetical protein